MTIYNQYGSEYNSKKNNEDKKPRKTAIEVQVLKIVAVISVVAALLGNINSIKDTLKEWFSPKNKNIVEEEYVIQDYSEYGDTLVLITDYLFKTPDTTGFSETLYSISYRKEQSDSCLRGFYTSPYFDSIDLGGNLKEVGVLGEGPYFSIPKIGIDIKLINNSDKPIFLHEAILEVEKSESILKPYMLLTQADNVLANLQFTNDGWLDIERMECIVNVLIADGNQQSIAFELPYLEIYPDVYHFSLFPILEHFGIDINKYAEGLALRNRTLLKELYNPLKDQLSDEIILLSKKQDKLVEQYHVTHDQLWTEIYYSILERFGEYIIISSLDDSEYEADPMAIFENDLKLNLKGQLKYWYFSSNKLDSTIHFFNSPISLTPSIGLGAGSIGISGEYDIQLHEEDSNYKISSPISQAIEPLSVDRFVIWVAADKTSRHSFNVSLLYNNDKVVTSKMISLDYFMSKSENAIRKSINADTISLDDLFSNQIN